VNAAVVGCIRLDDQAESSAQTPGTVANDKRGPGRHAGLIGVRKIARIRTSQPPDEKNMRMTRLIPMLPVRSMPASVEFYKKLGFTVEKRNDSWRWAMLVSGECRLMVDESINVHPQVPRTSVLYLYPDDVRQYHQQLRAAGLAVPDLDTSFYDMTEFRFDDPDGNRLWIGQAAAESA